MRPSMNSRNYSKYRKYQDDSDTEEDLGLVQQHSSYSRKSIIGNKTPITKEKDSYNYRNNYDEKEDLSAYDRYDSEDISPEGKGLTIKQPIRTNIRRNSNNSSCNNNNLNQNNKSSFVPKEFKNNKMTYEEDFIKNNSSHPIKLLNVSKPFLIDETNIQSLSPPPSTYHSVHDSKLEYKTRNKPIATNQKFVQSSGYINIEDNKVINYSNNKQKDNTRLTYPIKTENRRNLKALINKNESEDEYFSQESSSNDIQDFNDISIEPVSRLNIIQESFTVKHAFQISPKKSLINNNNNQTNIRKLNCIPLLSESKDVIDDEEDCNSIELLDSESIIDNNTYSNNAYDNDDDDDDKSKESEYTYDPCVIKDGEFYSDYIEKSKSVLIKSNKSSRYDSDDSHDKQALTKTTMLTNNDNNNSYNNNNKYSNNHYQEPISAPPALLKSSWVSVKLDQTTNIIEVSSRFSFVQVAHQSGIKTDRIQCTVIRDKKKSLHGKMYPTYIMILEETNKPIIIAQKMNLNRTSNYHLFDMTRAQLSKKLSKKSGNYIGKLRATNVNRTEYVLLNQNSEKEEIAGIRFDRLSMMNQLKDGNQPRKMKIMVPLLDDNKIPMPNRVHDTDGSGSLAEKLLKYEITAIGTEKNADLYVFESKDPVYENGNYRLNFTGRVNLPSVKNFQMVARNNIDDIICQFGKVDEDIFHLDYKEPINACQAFAFALCQFNL